MDTINKSKLFNASCIALIVTAMTFAIRAGILSQLGTDFGLNDKELGYVNMMAFWGFPVATIVGGLLYNYLGARNLMWIAFFTHILGLVMTVYAGGFWTLLLSSFFIGFANGTVEAGCNPMVADMFPENKTTMLNRFHVWFPGGIVIGSLVSQAMTHYGFGWEAQVGIMLIPTLIYGLLIFGEKFPESQNIVTSTATNIKSLATPLFIFIAICMTLTATAELGTQQWIEKILGNTGAHPMLVLALVTGLMAVGRFFAGPIVHRLNPVGVLLASSIVATAGIYMMSMATGNMVYIAAIMFALGVTYFWPTMIGFVAEYLPKTGALGMSLVGGAGMLATGIWQPVIGGWLDTERAAAKAAGMTQEAAELAAGQATLDNLALFPAVLIILFGILYMMRGKFEGNKISTAH